MCEGVLTEVRFTHAMSGLFGHDLPLKEWTDIEQTANLLLDRYDFRRRDPSLAIG